MLFPLFFPSSHFALYWGTLAIKKVDAFIPSEDSVSSCWAVFPWLFERVRLLPIASWIHTKNVQVERDLEDHQSTLPVTDKAIDPRSVKSQDLSRLTWPISASLEKNLPFLVSQCWALKKKKDGALDCCGRSLTQHGSLPCLFAWPVLLQLGASLLNLPEPTMPLPRKIR